jgi:hypothetical protein
MVEEYHKKENQNHPKVKAIYTENDAIHEENQMMRKLVKDQQNYSIDSHVTTTSDGFILKMFRVYPKNMTRF